MEEMLPDQSTDEPVDERFEEEPAPPNEAETLRNKVAELEKMIKDSQLTGYRTLDSQRNLSIDRFVKAVAFIEQKGIGKYDPATGEIIAVEAKADTSTDYDSQITDIDRMIKEKNRELQRKVDNGDITSAEKLELMEEFKDPLIMKRSEILAEKIAEKKTREAIKPLEEMSKKYQPIKDEITESFTELRSQYPDADNTNSLLYQKMNQIYISNPLRWKDANYGEIGADGSVIKYTGNPEIRKALIEEAEQALVKEGKIKKSMTDATKKKFSTLDSQTYEPGEGDQGARLREKTGMSDSQVNILVSQGFKDKSLLKYVNHVYSQYSKTGVMTMDV
jgi:hypothetical protein